MEKQPSDKNRFVRALERTMYALKIIKILAVFIQLKTLRAFYSVENNKKNRNALAYLPF